VRLNNGRLSVSVLERFKEDTRKKHFQLFEKSWTASGKTFNSLMIFIRNVKQDSTLKNVEIKDKISKSGTDASKKFWSSMSFPNLIRLSQI
jgi:hypothetical protein